MTSRLVLIRGIGDVASAVAHVLFKAGHRVLCHDIAAPGYSRRGMAFTDAIFDGAATLDGVLARRAPDLEALQHMLGCGNGIPVTAVEFSAVRDWVCPTVMVDARMRKRAVPETQIGVAPLTIGLGPGFIGLTHDHVPVGPGEKVIEVDPRGERAGAFGLGQRPRRIAQGVLQAISAAKLTPAHFRFEAGFEPALECILMLARFKLDACGIKVPLEDWRALPVIVRRRLMEMPAETSELTARYVRYFTEVLARHTQASPQPLPIEPSPAWAHIAAAAPDVVCKATSLGVDPPSSEQWARLTPLQRFALFKLTRKGHGNRNFLPALREFGLA